MTRKDFELIARTIAHLILREDLKHGVAVAFARELRITNPRFDADRFIAAATAPTR
jgi:hypothetical protein